LASYEIIFLAVAAIFIYKEETSDCRKSLIFDGFVKTLFSREVAKNAKKNYFIFIS